MSVRAAWNRARCGALWWLVARSFVAASSPVPSRWSTYPATVPESVSRVLELKANPRGGIDLVWDQRPPVATTLNPQLQSHLRAYLRRQGEPIATAVMVDLASEEIVALVEGRPAPSWSDAPHSAWYSGFPAASVFKIVTAAAAIETLGYGEQSPIEFSAGCGEAHSRGRWLRRPFRHTLSLARGFGSSCNNVFATLGVEQVGLAAMLDMAERLGWQRTVPVDVPTDPSHMLEPDPMGAGAAEVGQFAAGFGRVALSPLHAAWLASLIAGDGYPPNLKLLAHPHPGRSRLRARILPARVTFELRQMMRHTILRGTATGTFRLRPYRTLMPHVGGKTGTLTGYDPAGVTTWFVGMFPLERPQVAVATIVVNPGTWVIKASHLAAEAFIAWRKSHPTVPLAKTG